MVSRGGWRALYPFEPKSADLGGRAMSYLDEGAGETVLLVHGNPSWSFYFRELVLALRSSHRCLAPDHVGMGLSGRPAADPYTLKSRVDDLDELMRRAAPDGPVTLVLHDWGGMIGMGWAARHPERVRAIVAFNTACFRLPEAKRFPRALAFLRGPGGWLLRTSRAARRAVLRSCVARRPLPPEVESAYLEPFDGWAASRAAQRFVRDIPLSPADPSWGELAAIEEALPRFSRTPALLPWGMKDWVFDAAFLDEWTRRFPQATVRRFEDCGHFLLEDAPERVAPLIRDFIARPVPA